MSVALISYIPELVVPKDERYSFDKTVQKIIEALRKRNWQVPGITVKFAISGSGFEKQTYVERIIGRGMAKNEKDASGALPISTDYNGEVELFVLEFGRDKGRGIREIIFREEQLDLGYSGHEFTYKLYVGPGSSYYPPKIDEFTAETERLWYLALDTLENQAEMPDEEKAREMFMHSNLVSMRHFHEPRIALLYEGSDYSGEDGCVVNSQLNEEDYKALPSEPQQLRVSIVFDHFGKRLKKILKHIEEFPTAQAVDEFAYYTPEPLVPIGAVSHPLDEMYTVVNLQDYCRIIGAKKDGGCTLPKNMRYVLRGRVRLAPLDLLGAPEIAYDGFCWCGHLTASWYELASDKELRYRNGVLDIPYCPSLAGLSCLRGLLRISPKYANGCYVVDGAAYMKVREEIEQTVGKTRDHFTPEEMNAMWLARALTIVPLERYDGTYEKPILLVNRELDFDEVEPIGEIAE